MHEEGYLDEWNPLRWISQEDIEVCSDEKRGRPHASVARKNAPYYDGGCAVWSPGFYRVKLEIIKGVRPAKWGFYRKNAQTVSPATGATG